MGEITVVIIRQAPPAGAYRQTYRVPRAGMLRVLDILNYVYENLDPSLAFRNLICRDGVCHACFLVVNGKRSMSCFTPVRGLGDTVEIGPAPGEKVVRDLVVEHDYDLPPGPPVVFESDPHGQADDHG